MDTRLGDNRLDLKYAVKTANSAIEFETNREIARGPGALFVWAQPPDLNYSPVVPPFPVSTTGRAGRRGLHIPRLLPAPRKGAGWRPLASFFKISRGLRPLDAPAGSGLLSNLGADGGLARAFPCMIQNQDPDHVYLP